MIVTKRDKTTEDFDKNKIFRVVKAAGLSTEQAEQLTAAVEKQMTDKTHITSLEIRDEVSTQLHSIDEYAANMFDWYQEQKEQGKV